MKIYFDYFIIGIGSQSDVGYSSMKEDGQANQTPKCSSQKDLPTAVKGESL